MKIYRMSRDAVLETIDIKQAADLIVNCELPSVITNERIVIGYLRRGRAYTTPFARYHKDQTLASQALDGNRRFID